MKEPSNNEFLVELELQHSELARMVWNAAIEKAASELDRVIGCGSSQVIRKLKK